MKKTILITPNFPPEIGGIQTYLYNLAKNIKNIIVIAPSTKGSFSFDKKQTFKIYRVFGAHKFFLFLNIIKIILRERPTLLIVGHVIMAPIAWILNIPYVIIVYGMEIMRKKREKFLIHTLKKASKIITISKFTSRYIINLGIEETKIEKIYPCIDTNFFTPYVDPSPIVKRYNLEDKKVLLTVGRMDARERYKGHDTVIELLPEILKKVPNVVYLLVGDGTDKERLKNLAVKKGVAENVIFTGNLQNSELPMVYSACDIFIMLSKVISNEDGIMTEGFGIVFLEASACGKPVIGGRSGGVEEAIVDGITGILVNPLDKKEILDAILTLLTDDKLAHKMGEEGRKRAKWMQDNANIKIY